MSTAPEFDKLEYLKFLYRHGHFWRPDATDAHNVQWEDLPKLARGPVSKVVRDATQVFQQSDQNLEFLALEHHKRPLIPDGDIGMATHQMASFPRCMVPDWAPPEGARFASMYEDPELSKQITECINSMRAFATGSGSWPVPGCDPERPNRAREHSVRVNVDTSRASSFQKSVLRQVLDNVEAVEAEVGQHVRHILDGNPQEAEHDVRFQPIPGGVIGFAYFPTPGTCRQTVTCRIDNTYNQDVHMLSSLFIHEYKGHSDGLQHTRGGIMNPSILRTRLSWIGDPHEATKTRFFGGEPIDSGPEPDPEPGPPDQDHNGLFVYTPDSDWLAGESRVLKIRVQGQV